DVTTAKPATQTTKENATPTQAPGTTTTAAPGTTTSGIPETTPAAGACTLREGMESEKSIRAGWVTSDPPTDNAEDARPGTKAAWTVASDNNPALLITLVEDGNDAFPVGHVELTSNVAQITCTLTEGMSSETTVPDSFITTEPEFEDVTALRSSNKDTFTVSSDQIPAIIIRLVKEGDEPVSVGEVVVDGEVSQLEVFYMESDNEDAEFTPVSRGNDETPEVFEAEDATPQRVRAVLPNKVFAVVVKIVAKYVGPDAPKEIDIKDVKVFACFEEVTTTVTTTPEATTTITTTTRVTPTTTTVTSVQTTTLPAPTTTENATPTQAPGTTTTAAPGTTTSGIPETTPAAGACTLREGMESEKSIRAGWVTSDPPTDNAEDARPGTKATWTVASDNNPALLITLVEDGNDAIPVGRVELTSNVAQISVLYKTSSAADEPYKAVTKDTKGDTPQAPGTTTTAAPGTTTSGIPETTPAAGACTLREGMESEKSIRAGWVTSDPPTDNAEDARPGTKAAWTVASDNNPALLITLVEDGNDAIPVGRVELTSNVAQISVLYKTSSAADEPYKAVTKDTKSDTPQVFKANANTETITATMPEGIFATGLKVVLLTTPESPAEYRVNSLGVYACFEEELTTTTTTPAQQTTTQKTTTQFTSSATTITTELTTTRPTTPQI
ncbi:hypothetical protein CAPTEDRAFT_204807, partial [Capitella teleta]